MSKYDKRNMGEERYPYSFQQKLVLRHIRNKFSGKERASLLLVYSTICWIASDFSNEESEKEVNNWPKVISKYSGVGKGTAQKCIKKLNGLGLINYLQDRSVNGRWNKRKIILPAELPEEVIETTDGITEDGSTKVGETLTL